MRNREHEELLSEILAGQELAELRSASLARGRSAMRHRIWRRRVLKGTVFAILPIVGAILVFRDVGRNAAPQPVLPPKSQAKVQGNPARSNVRIISDEELLALFKDQPVALIGRPGHQELVFLGRPDEG